MPAPSLNPDPGRVAVDSNLWLWLGQILLALGFLGASYGHTLGFESSSKRHGMEWLAAVGRDRMRVIGSLEILGAVGLVLPIATRVLPWLTPAAALCLGLLMVFAIVFHARRTGEPRTSSSMSSLAASRC